MKNQLLSLLLFSIGAIVHAQTPSQFKYQAILRDLNGGVLKTETKIIRVEILKGDVLGPSVFTESHNVTTTEQGIINLSIGSINTTGLATVNWSEGVYFIKISIDNTEMGTSQILSVPYAIQAKYAEIVEYGNLINKPNLFSGSYSDLSNKPNLFSGSYSDLSNKPNLFSGSYPDLSNKPVLPLKISDLQLDASNHVITNVTSPINATDVANKAYVDILFDKLLKLQAEIGVKDLEDNTYKAVKIGTQIWMSENLKATKYNDGTSIDLVTDNNTWGTLSSSAYCWYNNDEATNSPAYGALYNWYAVNSGKLCPSGWHVPTKDEWLTLQTFLGGNAVAGGKMKETGTTNWSSPNTGADNSSGFSGVPGGTRSGDSAPGFSGVFGNISTSGSYWSATALDASFAYFVLLSSTSTELYLLQNDFKRHGVSVRCIHD
jgi:uncharacterized protein (TIGR02145 family)